MTVDAIVKFDRSQNILCQSRGSATNSAVCYVLGITSIDPVRSNLLLERFISQERKEPPDIDVDFEHDRREIVMQWIFDTYGRHRSAVCSTVIASYSLQYHFLKIAVADTLFKVPPHAANDNLTTVITPFEIAHEIFSCLLVKP